TPSSTFRWLSARSTRPAFMVQPAPECLLLLCLDLARDAPAGRRRAVRHSPVMVPGGGGGRHWGNYQTPLALCAAPGDTRGSAGEGRTAKSRENRGKRERRGRRPPAAGACPCAQVLEAKAFSSPNGTLLESLTGEAEDLLPHVLAPFWFTTVAP